MKPRQPGSIEDALTMICGAIGFGVAAQAVGRSEQHVRRWTDPDDDSLPNVKQAMQLEVAALRAVGQMPLTTAMMRWMKAVQRAENIEVGKAEPVSQSVMDVAVQLGTLTASVREAMRDDRMSANERNRILRELARMRDEMDDLERSVMAVGRMSDPPAR